VAEEEIGESEREGTEESEREEEYMCPLCGGETKEVKTPTGIRYQCKECGKFVSPVTAEEGERPIVPPRVELRERILKLLPGKLSRVYGIGATKVAAIVSMVKDNPTILENPYNLYAHIKNFAPKAHDYHLILTINSIFNKLREEGYYKGELMPVMMEAPLAQPSPPVFAWSPWGAPSTWYQWPPQYPPPAHMAPPADYGVLARREAREQREHELRMKKLEEEFFHAVCDIVTEIVEEKRLSLLAHKSLIYDLILVHITRMAGVTQKIVNQTLVEMAGGNPK